MKILACNSNKPLASLVAESLNTKLTEADIKRFADNEVYVEIKESVRGQDIYVIQSTSYPSNDNIMELLVTLDALKRASAERITAVIPYFGYARQDRKSVPRTPISAKLVANIITSAGANRVLTLDLHAGQIQGFFDIPVDNLYSEPVFVRDIKQNFALDNLVIISPDAGGVFRARNIAKRLDVDLAIIDKRREKPGISQVMNIIGDVQNKDCIIVDDIIDSGGTLCNAATAIMEKGAKSVTSYITHGVLSGQALDKISKSALRELVITDSISNDQLIANTEKIRIVSIAPLLAEAIKRISEGKSVSTLFN